jgi:site-specific recombinase XerD
MHVRRAETHGTLRTPFKPLFAEESLNEAASRQPQRRARKARPEKQSGGGAAAFERIGPYRPPWAQSTQSLGVRNARREPMGKHRDRMQQELTLRGLSSNTCESYLRYARGFVAHFGRSADELGTEHVRRWLLWLLKVRKRDAATVNVAIAALRFLFATLGRPEVMQSIQGVRKQHRAPDILSGREVERLLAASSNVKHRAIFTLLYGAGLRVSEVVALTVSDIDSGRMVVHVRNSKNRYDRIVPLCPRMLQALREYWKARRPQGALLFPGQGGLRPLSRAAVAKAIRKTARSAGIAKKVYPHLMRHAFATHMLELGGDLRTVQILLGHSSLSSTTRYTHLTEARRLTLPSPLEALSTEQGHILG